MHWTNECYRTALLERYEFLSDYGDAKSLDDMKMILINRNMEINSPEITQLYYKQLRKLDDKKLNLIVEAYQKGKQKRSGETIEGILTELLERSAGPETKE